MYKKSQISLTATELERYVTKLELNLHFGKGLESNYYMQSTIREMMMLSSYIDGIYIIDTNGDVLYWEGEGVSQLDSPRLYEAADKQYILIDYADYTLVYMDINDKEDKLEGTLMIVMDTKSMSQLYDEYQKESLLQSIALNTVFAMLFLLILLRLYRKEKIKAFTFKLVMIVCFIAICVNSVDVAVETVKLNAKVSELTNQSVQKITQVLQQQVDSVMDKGVDIESAYNVHGWLKEIDYNLDSIGKLDYDSNGKVRAEMDEEFVRQTVYKAVYEMCKLITWMIVCSIIICFVVFYFSKKGKIRFENLKNIK